MARYGRDYGSRYARRKFSDSGEGYGAEYGMGGYDSGWATRTGGWGGRGRGYGWGRGRAADLGEGWRSTSYDRERMGDEGWGGSSAWRSGSYGMGGMYRGRYGGGGRGYYDREQFGRDRGRDYERDFADRLRRGWNRLREEARGWMGRGYDRGW